jgi:protein ImuB
MTAPSKRYLSVWLRRLSTDRIARASSASDETHALVVVAPIKSALRLTAVDDAAARLGLEVGMALADARAMHPGLAVANADSRADLELLAAIADWCDRYTPLVGLHPPDGLILDVSGCAHLFGGEAALCADLVDRLGAFGYRARAAVADTVGCAWAVARFAESLSLPRKAGEGGAKRRVGESSAATPPGAPGQRPGEPPSPFRGGMERGESDVPATSFVVPPGTLRDVLEPLPVAALRLPPEVVTLLGQVGLKCIGDVLDRPRATLAARFGTEFIRRLDQALGRDEESITPRLPAPCYVAEQRFADPIALERDVLGTIERLSRRLAGTLEQHGEGARLVETALFRVDGKVQRVSAATSRAIRDAALIRRLFAERLAAIGDAHDPGFGFDLVRLAVIVSEPLDPRQTGFATPDTEEELARLIDRLAARVGFSCVLRIVPHDTHIPEYTALEVRADACLGHSAAPGRCAADPGLSFLLTSAQAPPTPNPSPPLARARGGRGAPAPSAWSDMQDTLAPPRPLKLLVRPEPIEAVAEVPDGPPVRFRWRHVLHEVAVAEGPERIAMEWWRDESGSALTRDYFRVESRDGVRVWIFREGLYRGGARPNWFLHGLFG